MIKLNDLLDYVSNEVDNGRDVHELINFIKKKYSKISLEGFQPSKVPECIGKIDSKTIPLKLNCEYMRNQFAKQTVLSNIGLLNAKDFFKDISWTDKQKVHINNSQPFDTLPLMNTLFQEKKKKKFKKSKPYASLHFNFMSNYQSNDRISNNYLSNERSNNYRSNERSNYNISNIVSADHLTQNPINSFDKKEFMNTDITEMLEINQLFGDNVKGLPSSQDQTVKQNIPIQSNFYEPPTLIPIQKDSLKNSVSIIDNNKKSLEYELTPSNVYIKESLLENCIRESVSKDADLISFSDNESKPNWQKSGNKWLNSSQKKYTAEELIIEDKNEVFSAENTSTNYKVGNFNVTSSTCRMLETKTNRNSSQQIPSWDHRCQQIKTEPIPVNEDDNTYTQYYVKMSEKSAPSYDYSSYQVKSQKNLAKKNYKDKTMNTNDELIVLNDYANFDNEDFNFFISKNETKSWYLNENGEPVEFNDFDLTDDKCITMTKSPCDEKQISPSGKKIQKCKQPKSATRVRKTTRKIKTKIEKWRSKTELCSPSNYSRKFNISKKKSKNSDFVSSSGVSQKFFDQNNLTRRNIGCQEQEKTNSVSGYLTFVESRQNYYKGIENSQRGFSNNQFRPLTYNNEYDLENTSLGINQKSFLEKMKSTYYKDQSLYKKYLKIIDDRYGNKMTSKTKKTISGQVDQFLDTLESLKKVENDVLFYLFENGDKQTLSQDYIRNLTRLIEVEFHDKFDKNQEITDLIKEFGDDSSGFENSMRNKQEHLDSNKNAKFIANHKLDFNNFIQTDVTDSQQLKTGSENQQNSNLAKLFYSDKKISNIFDKKNESTNYDKKFSLNVSGLNKTNSTLCKTEIEGIKKKISSIINIDEKPEEYRNTTSRGILKGPINDLQSEKQNLLKSEKHLLTKSNKSKLATITQNRSDIFYSIQDDRNYYESRQNSSPKSFYLEDQTLQSKTIGSNIFQSINQKKVESDVKHSECAKEIKTRSKEKISVEKIIQKTIIIPKSIRTKAESQVNTQPSIEDSERLRKKKIAKDNIEFYTPSKKKMTNKLQGNSAPCKKNNSLIKTTNNKALLEKTDTMKYPSDGNLLSKTFSERKVDRFLGNFENTVNNNLLSSHKLLLESNRSVNKDNSSNLKTAKEPQISQNTYSSHLEDFNKFMTQINSKLNPYVCTNINETTSRSGSDCFVTARNYNDINISDQFTG